MLQRYKLRLGDGTVLLVDHEGLSTWLVDRKATVQAGRSRKWHPLKEFLAQERARARREARRRATLPEAAPPVTPTPAAQEGPLLADSPVPREDGLPLVPPPPKDVVPTATPPPVPREDGLPLVPPPPRDDGSPLAASPPAGEEPPVVPWPPEPEPLPPGLPFPQYLEPSPALDTRPENEPARVTVGEPRLLGFEAAAPLAATAAVNAIEPTPIDEPPGVQALAEEPLDPGPTEHEASPFADLSVIPLKPLEVSPAEHHRAAPTPVEELPVIPLKAVEELPVIRLKAVDERAPAPRPPSPRTSVGPPAAGVVPGEWAWTDGRTASVLRAVGRLGHLLSRCLDPINRLERGRPLFPAEEGRAWLEEPGPGSPAPPPAPPVPSPPEIRPLAEDPSLPTGGARRSSTHDRLPTIPVEGTDDHDLTSRLSKRGRELFAAAAGWRDRLTARVARLARLARLARPGRPRTSIPAEEPVAPLVAAPLLARPAHRETVQAPPAISELPALRLAPIDEPRGVEDVYEDDEAESLARPATWLWTKRLAWATVLLVIGSFAVMNWDAWFPQATELGERGLIQIDEQVRSTHFARQQQEAVAEAARQLPHLAPETIRLVMASSPVRVLDARAVFEIACDAADRGRSVLTAGEVAELKALRLELLDTLLPSERDRIRGFERARAREAVFPLDARLGLRSYARGARELPAESRERLQELLGQAIAAGLAKPSETARTGSANGP